jgi:hypothetical protein
MLRPRAGIFFAPVKGLQEHHESVGAAFVAIPAILWLTI